MDFAYVVLSEWDLEMCRAECDGGTATWALNILLMSGRWRVYIWSVASFVPSLLLSSTTIRNIPFSQDLPHWFQQHSSSIFFHQLKPSDLMIFHKKHCKNHCNFPIKHATSGAWINMISGALTYLLFPSEDDPHPEKPCRGSPLPVLQCCRLPAISVCQAGHGVTFVPWNQNLAKRGPFPKFFFGQRGSHHLIWLKSLLKSSFA
jgi:hypothetical protein